MNTQKSFATPFILTLTRTNSLGKGSCVYTRHNKLRREAEREREREKKAFNISTAALPCV